MALCFCDICDYKDKCKNYRKVVACPYMETEEQLWIKTFVIIHQSLVAAMLEAVLKCLL